MAARPSATSLTPERIGELIQAPPFRGRQIHAWLLRGVFEFSGMTDLPAEMRQRLPEVMKPLSSTISEKIRSRDNTRKLLVRMEDSALVECVLIPEGSRLTLCMSSQVGCPAKCAFCASGMLGLTRNLADFEIFEQFLHAACVAGGVEKITNVVMMGMGEPLLNYDALVSALRRLPLSSRRVTVSTVGLPDRIRRLAAEGLKVNLAVSLHAPDDEIRNKLVPVNSKFGIAEVVRAARDYFEETGRDVTFEYILIEGMNASEAHARMLVQLLGRGNLNVNLIPMNPVEGLPWQPPADHRVEAFRLILSNAGIPTHVRRPRGRDVDAACGQLRLRRVQAEGA